ncbi:uncharacterized protein LOC131024553 [Salvia miltiorrhiza]|uniref:uncharacterized protein LOC131024553 n=1 Tax=Salvia miltiorrhiza TaxID=226208 RepID=UPI0025AC4166|nr:uncharacterized protein LOC131024553 [Salvia miltiorrhiza]
MGCTSSKRIEVAVDAYRPPPSSFAVFDVNAIEEPWLKDGSDADRDDEKPPPVPPPLLDKLNGAIDAAPRTWDEVSKALEDLKPKLAAAALPPPPPNPVEAESPAAAPQAMRKNFSFHTLEELETKVAAKPVSEKKRVEPAAAVVAVARSLKDNIFIQKDREEREKEGRGAGFVRRDPLGDFEAICPPGGEDAVVVYTTSLGGVRRTYEDCNRVRQLMETYQVVFDERDVALDGGFRGELRGLVGEGAAVPRVFVKGRYIGGAEEVVGLNETGRLSRILNWAKVERGAGRLGCRGCGGARFVPCLGCGGSCKILVGGVKERCGECNENGLVHCPICV